ncbi:50S ribosomal protein L10 [Patescibacteria group bacterium]|nr:50S ribosomal protein L10 [Patescibacteria group bacterium]MCG2695257.1 50S ribosomal protein L10 [Candidatus Parcubacteria bacterium]
MAISKEKKGEIYKKLSDNLKKAQSVVFVNFHGLGVGETTNLRRKLKEDKVNYVVAKKTLIKKALEAIKHKGEMPQLDGEVALAYSNDDLTAPARGVYDFLKIYKNKLAILGGVFEGKYMNMAEMTEIASIPSMLILRGQFVNLINSPLQGLVIALDKIAEKKS